MGLAVYIPSFLLLLHNKEGDPNNAQREVLKRDPERQVSNSMFLYLHSFLYVRTQFLMLFSLLFFRYQSSSQDSAASSLTAEKTPHQQQERNFTAEDLQVKGNPSSNRRKRLVRQFSLWVQLHWRAKVLGTCGAEGVAEPSHRAERCEPDLVSS